MIVAFDTQARDRLAFAPPTAADEAWVPATEHALALTKVEAPLDHAIDEQATKNPEVIATHQAAPQSAQRAAILAADARWQVVIERLREKSVAIKAEVLKMAEVESRLIAQPTGQSRISTATNLRSSRGKSELDRLSSGERSLPAGARACRV